MKKLITGQTSPAIFLALAAVSLTAQAHDGVLNSAPWDACADKQQNNVCAFTNSHEDIYPGTCQVMADSLYCVRNQPIIRYEDIQFGVIEDEHEHGEGEDHVHH